MGDGHHDNDHVVDGSGGDSNDTVGDGCDGEDNGENGDDGDRGGYGDDDGCHDGSVDGNVNTDDGISENNYGKVVCEWRGQAISSMPKNNAKLEHFPHKTFETKAI